ncbi:MAG: hypothetical protein PWQ12_283 [Clostridiales bacterium]|nr:hypothetical protein [Clostridiales bacterium]
MPFIAKYIEAEMTYPLRQQILRVNQPPETCRYETDSGEGAFHVGVFDQETLICIVSFLKEAHPGLPLKQQYHLRGMATLESYRHCGAGRMAVSFAESEIKTRGTDLLWCNARLSAQNYYEKLGFVTFGDVFDYPTIGPHIVMYHVLGE